MAAELDKELQTAVKAAKGGRPMQFAFVPKGTEGKLVVAKKVSSKQAADLKKEVGGTALFRGRLIAGDGGVVFELVKEPPPTLLAQLKKRLKVDAGLTFAIDVRVASDAEAEAPAGEAGEGTPPTAPPKVPPPPDGSAVAKRFNDLAAALKAALAAKGPNAARIQSLAVAVNGLLKNNDFAQAGKALDELEPLLKAKPPQTPPPVVNLTAVLDDWQAASEEVDKQIAKLQRVLKSTGNEALVQIAEYGLNGVTGNHKVRLTAAALELRRAAGPAVPGLAAKALPVVAGFRAHLAGSEEVEVCDDNPFGVAVTIRETLGGALAQLEQALRAAAKA